jgi:uncharacterized protein DUF4019
MRVSAFVSVALGLMLGPALAADNSYIAVAQAWLALLDQGKYAESWGATGSYFQSVVTQDDFVRRTKATRDEVGALKVRNLQNQIAATQAPGAPDGQYEELDYRTDFANAADQTEVVVLRREGDAWKVTGYGIK